MTVATPPRAFALFTDETNKDASAEAHYFIYGGVIIPFENFPAIHSAIEVKRRAYKFPSDAPLKFASSSRPKIISPEVFSSLKNDVLEISIQNNVQFIAYLVPHQIAQNQGTSTTIEYGLNTVLQKFQQFLKENNGVGVVFIDRPNMKDPFKCLASYFQKGLKYEESFRPLSKIQCFSLTCAGASHASSVIDIILGGFGYCVNSSRESDMVAGFLPKAMRLMWGRSEGVKKNLTERGLVLRPLKMLESYKAQTTALINKLVEIANRKQA